MASMIAIADDPIIRCLERTGLAPWQSFVYDDYDDEEDPDEHDDYSRSFFSEPWAVYEGEYV